MATNNYNQPFHNEILLKVVKDDLPLIDSYLVPDIIVIDEAQVQSGFFVSFMSVSLVSPSSARACDI